MIIKGAECNYFDDLANYIILLVSLTLTFQTYSGGGTPYREKDSMKFAAKQMGRYFILYPHKILNTFFKKGVFADEIEYEEESIQIPLDAQLKLGILEKPLYTIGSNMFGNYFESFKQVIAKEFGPKGNWPDEWNFGRVVRNAVFHDGCVSLSPNEKATWRGLTYTHSDNSKKLMNGDLWPADLIYLIMDMDLTLNNVISKLK